MPSGEVRMVAPSPRATKRLLMNTTRLNGAAVPEGWFIHDKPSADHLMSPATPMPTKIPFPKATLLSAGELVTDAQRPPVEVRTPASPTATNVAFPKTTSHS